MLYGDKQGSWFGRLGPRVVLAGSMAAAALTIMLFLGLKAIFGGPASPATEQGGKSAASVEQAGPAAAKPADPGKPADAAKPAEAKAAPKAESLPLAATRKQLAGEQLIESGKAKEALAWAESFAGSEAEKAKASLVRGKALAGLGRADEAKEVLRSLASGASLVAAEAKVELLRMEGKSDADAARALWAGAPKSRGGARAALMLADCLWDNSRNKASVNECKADLEECRLAYTEALVCGDLAQADEGRSLSRLDTLSRMLVLNKSAETSKPGSAIHTVRSGESPASIAAKHGVPVGQIARLNGLPEKTTLQVGQRLKILPGKWRLLVRRSTLAMLVLWEGTFVKKFPVGIGPGEATPLGEFTITKKTVNPDWYYNGQRIPFGDPKNVLGTRWMGFDPGGPGRGLGVHGTTEPDSVPGRRSKGCIRMLNADAEEVYDLAPTGTVVEITD